MSTVYDLDVHRRIPDEISVRKLKSQGELPAVFYGKDHEPVPISIKAKHAHSIMQHRGSLIRLHIVENDETLLAIPKEIQKAPVSHEPIHISFEGVKEEETFHINLPVRLNHREDSPWSRSGGTLMQKVSFLNVEVLPRDLPERIEVDVSDLKIGDIMHVSDLQFPHLKFLDPPQTEIAGILKSYQHEMSEAELSGTSESAPYPPGMEP